LQATLHTTQLTGIPSLKEIANQVCRTDKRNTILVLGGFDAQCDSKMRLSSPNRPRKDQVSGFENPVAT